MSYNPNIHHRRSIRLKEYDYSQEGLYFITICTHNRKCLFGNIIDGEMVLNEYGFVVYNEWIRTQEVRLDMFVVMPNHIHGIIQIVARRGVSHTPEASFIEGVCDTPLRSPANTIGAIVRGYKSSITRQMRTMGFVEAIWQRNYYEHIIRSYHSYQEIFDYICTNPQKWNVDKFYVAQNTL